MLFYHDFSYNSAAKICHTPHHDSLIDFSSLKFATSSDYIGYIIAENSGSDSIAGVSASESNIIYWKSSAGDSNNNHDMAGISSLQNCYDVCQIVNGGVCWVFRYHFFC